MKKRLLFRGLGLAVSALAFCVLPLHHLFAEQSSRPPVPVIPVIDSPGPIVTWQNAPSPDPGVLDGVYMIYNPLKPSDGPYPALSPGEKVWIDVSITQQLVYIFHGTQRIYTMATSSGLQNIRGDGSPPGIYQIQAERGRWFYLPKEHVGAEYWVSWKGNGAYLFHSIPMNRNKQIMPYVAAHLLREASWGCFLLTVADARWIYNNIPFGTTVIVQRGPVLLKGNKIYAPNEAQSLAAFLTAGPGAGAP